MTTRPVVTVDPKLAGSTVTTLASSIYHGAGRLDIILGLVKQVIKGELWRSYALPGGGPLAQYDDFITFVEDGLRTTVTTLRDLCRRDAEALTLLGQALAGKPGNPTGVNQRGGFSSIRTQSSSKVPRYKVLRGTTREYALRRLAKARPDLHKKVVAKELLG